MMKNTKIVPCENDLHEEILKAEQAVCFVFTSLGSDEPYLSTLSNYLQQTPKPDESQDPHPPDQWYNSREEGEAMRHKAKLFSDFAEANEENKNITFLTVGLTNETQKGASIYLYTDGFLVNENFEPPSKPATVTGSDINHNSVTLNISPPRFGAEDITSYSVECCVSGEDDWKQETASKAEEVTVSGLSPNTEYMFRCRAETPVGAGPANEVRGSIKTLPCSPPGKPNVESISREISVSWEKPAELGQDVHVLSYIVEYAKPDQQVKEEDLHWEQMKAGAEKAIISGLQPETEYAVRVRCDCGAAGRSKESIAVNVGTTKPSHLTEFLKGGEDPPRGGVDPPRGGEVPPGGGEDPPRGGEDPPRGGEVPPGGGEDPPRGGEVPPGGGRTPLEEVWTPLEEVKTTLEEVRTPLEEVRTTLEEVRTPLEEVRSPLEEVRTTLEEVRSPLEEVRTPLEEVQVHLQHPWPILVVRKLMRGREISASGEREENSRQRLLKPKQGNIGSIRRLTLGSGKSTLINAMVNYAMGVEFEDNVWYQIIQEEKKSQTESQTSDVIVYEVFGHEDRTLPFSLTIIDTPGYGHTEGIERDVLVSERLLDLFRSTDGVDEIDAVCLVLKASDNRLTDRLMYVFDSVVSLFGKDIEENIVALITHSNFVKPDNVLQSLKDENIRSEKNEEGQPVHFMFDNTQKTERNKRNERALKNAWESTEDEISQFADFLKKTKPQNLKDTVEVLNTRIGLTACIKNLQERIEFIELKQRDQTDSGSSEETRKRHEE
ncbi:hypothetical protein F7725_021267 [Dissostichus mawsoni]|uniref:Fibronectin type-III domain-containing protein n=1 Tax=Dissostichus mawsoni TaxID=36200 RepID=A0A7J5YHJ0_DISMA|nr:hypothetical protein F7725_021267 [Dissostichus mawsoni]